MKFFGVFIFTHLCSTVPGFVADAKSNSRRHRDVTGVTTPAPETTTKKRGFFSGIADFFRPKGNEETTTTSTTSTTTQRSTSTSTIKASVATSTTTERSTSSSTRKTSVTTSSTARPDTNYPATTLPPIPNAWSTKAPTSSPATTHSVTQAPPQRFPISSTPKIQSRPGTPSTSTSTSTTSTSTQQPTRDDFPPLSGNHNHQQRPTSNPNTRPNAWGQPLATPAPQPPNAWGKPPVNPPPSPPNAWGKPPGTASTQSYFIPTKNPNSFPQTTASSVSAGPVTDAELLTLSESLFSKDVNNPFKYVTVNYQGRTYSSANTDEASQP